MNLSNIKLRLFKATISNYVYADAFGVHIGDDLPKEKDVLISICSLYIAGYSISEVTSLLADHKIYATDIREISTLLSTKGVLK